MTAPDTHDPRADSARLIEALRQPDALECAKAEILIAMLVQAEAMGEDVDDDPRFAPVLRHLDHCADCLALYEEVSEELAVTTAQQLGQLGGMPLDIRPGQHVQMRPLEPVRRRFEMIIPNPRHHRPTMLRERPEPYGVRPVEPQVQIDITEGEHGLTLRVVLLDVAPGESWLVTVTADGFYAEARTDVEGDMLFSGVPVGEPVRVSGEGETP
jgi:hypothetical protein